MSSGQLLNNLIYPVDNFIHCFEQPGPGTTNWMVSKNRNCTTNWVDSKNGNCTTNWLVDKNRNCTTNWLVDKNRNCRPL